MIEVLFVGTGDAFGSGGRRQTAILLREGKNTILLDCGPTTLLGLREMGIDPREIDTIALSHFHGDHAGGVPFLLLDYTFAHERTNDLQIIGPPGVKERVAKIARAMSFETSHTKRPFDVHYREYTVDQPLEVQGFRVTPKPAYHQAHTMPHMLRVDGDRRSVFFTGDTGWHEQLPDRVGDADLLISECVFMDDPFEYHLSYREIAAAQERFRCGSTILTHLGAEVLENLDLLEFDTAHDGLVRKV